jgi:cell division protein FtsA
MGSPVVVLDIGASKVHCLVGEAVDEVGLKIIGMGLSPCEGIRRTVVIDMPKMVEAIRSAVREAERSAGLKIVGAYVGVAGEDIETHTNRGAVAISGSSNPIDENDVQRALAAAEEASSPPGSATVLHRFVQNYTLDGEHVQNPLWLHGSRLEVETLSATAPAHVCTTLRRAVSQAGVDIAGFILEAVAVGSALLSVDEREMGVGILDIGAGTSDLSIYRGSFRYLAEIPFGGEDITKDLSVVLNMSPREAEGLKREEGCVRCPAESADEAVSFSTTAGRPHTLVRHQLSAVIEARQQEILEFAAKGLKREEGCVRCPAESADEAVSFSTTAGRPHTLVRHQLSAVIEARQQEILEFAAKEIKHSQQGHLISAGMVLTGGGALLGNLDKLGEEVLGMPVRIGSPQDVVALEASDPTFSTPVGLLRFATEQHDSPGSILPAGSGRRGGFFGRLTRIFSFLT